jgi:acetyl-CoA carboxylase carboxyl transferase subunit beta
MSWLRDFVLPKIRSKQKEDIPNNLWEKCPKCDNMLFHRELKENFDVCHHCEFHKRMSAKDRINMLLEEYEIIEIRKVATDPLKFKDLKKYTERLKDAKAKCDEAISVACGKISHENISLDIVLAVFDFNFMGGSMGLHVGEALVEGAMKARSLQIPYIVIPSSGGARMQEGIFSLMQMARSTAAIQYLKDANIPYITVLADPTTGGVAASFAMLGDIIIAEPGALIGFTGARVSSDTIRETLPKNFQTAEYLLEHGMVDAIVHRRDLKKYIVNLLSIITRKIAS